MPTATAIPVVDITKAVNAMIFAGVKKRRNDLIARSDADNNNEAIEFRIFTRRT